MQLQGSSPELRSEQNNWRSRADRPDEKRHAANDQQAVFILAPWTKPSARKFRELIQPITDSAPRTRPIRANRRVGLIRSIAPGRQRLDEIVSGHVTIEDIAVRQKCSARQIQLTLSMAFLAPLLVKAESKADFPVELASSSSACACRVVETISQARIAVVVVSARSANCIFNVQVSREASAAAFSSEAVQDAIQRPPTKWSRHYWGPGRAYGHSSMSTWNYPDGNALKSCIHCFFAFPS